jgi:heme o synthase
MRDSWAMDYWRLIRPRIVAFVLLAMGVSAWTTASARPQWGDLVHSLLGAAMVIAGAIALNQRWEYRGDAKMARTADRPLPAGRLSPRQVVWFGSLMSVVGLGYLAWTTNLLLTLLALAGWLVYVVVYTPLKTRSIWQTPIGAVAGATPVLLGAAAGGGSLNCWTYVLFGIVFFWQFPHSMAIAWRYRQEFAAAGVKVAPVTDPSGRSAGVWAVLGAVALLPVSLIPWLLGHAGAGYALAVLMLCGLYVALSLSFARRPDETTARRLLRASLVYLPAMLAVLLAVRWT